MIPENTINFDGKTIRNLNTLIQEKLLIREQEQLKFWIEEIKLALQSDLQGSRNNIKSILERMQNRHNTIFSERRDIMSREA